MHDVGSTPDVSSGGEALGGALQQGGQELFNAALEAKKKADEDAKRLADAKAANLILDRSQAVKQAHLNFSAGISDGSIKYTDATQAWGQEMAKLPPLETTIPNLDPSTAEHLRGGLARIDEEGAFEAAQTAKVAEHIDYRSQGGRGLDTLERTAALPGADSEKIAAQGEALRPLFERADIPKDQIDRTLEDFKNRIAANATQVAILKDPVGTRARLGAMLGLSDNSDPRKAQAVAILQQFEADQKNGDPNAQQTMDTALTKANLADYVAQPGFSASIGADGKPAANAPQGELKLLSPESAVQLYHAADAEVRRREAEAKQADEYGKVTIRQQVQDTQTALTNGDSVPLPDESAVTHAYGPEGGPILMQQLKTLQSAAGAMAALKNATPEETAKLIAAYKPSGADNREATQRSYDLLNEQAARIAAQRKADPGAFVLENAPTVAKAYQDFGALAAKGILRTPAETAQMMAANQRYLTASFAEQSRLAIDKPALPKAYVDAIARDYNASIINDPHGASQRLEATGRLLQNTPIALAQVAKEVGPAGLMAMEGVNPRVVQKLVNLTAVPEEERRKLLPTSIKPTDISTAVAQAFAPLTRTFVVQNADSAAARYTDAATKLTMDRVTRGEDATSAAQHVYQDLIGDRYHPITDTYRVPKTYPIEDVNGGMHALLEHDPPANLLVRPEPGFSPEESAQRLWRTAKAMGHWVNNTTAAACSCTATTVDLC